MPDHPPSIASFTVRGGPLDGRRLDADEAVDEILIGSDSDCKFYLDLPGVSPIHARVWMDLDGVTVHDTHSPRGVYVNDDRVKGQAPLRDRDILWLGAPGDESSVMIECRFAAGATPSAGVAAAPLVEARDALADLVPPEEAAAAHPAPAQLHPDATMFAMPAPRPVRAEPRIEELVSPEPAYVPEPEPAPEAAHGSDSGFDFFVEEPGAEPAAPEPAPASALDDLLTVEAAPPSAPDAAIPAPPPAAPVPEPASPLDEAFFVEDEAPAADAAGLVSEPVEDAFFVEESPAAAPFEEPFVLEEPHSAIPPPQPPAPSSPPPPPTAAPVPPPIPVAPPAAATLAAPPPPAAEPPPVEPPPIPKRKPPEAAAPAAPAPRPPRPASARVPPAAAPAAAPRAAAAKGGLPPVAKYGAIAAGALLLVGGVAVLMSRSSPTPTLEAATPSRVAPGQTLTLTGSHFAPQPQGNAVRIEGRPARILKATSTELQVEVPDLPAAGGRPSQATVTVSVGGRESGPAPITVYQLPRIHGVSPSVAMPGEEVTLAGTSWGMGAKVRFGSVEAPVVSATATALRVRVPEAAGVVGASIPVVVSMGSDESSPFPFLLGRLPLATGVEPRTASAGDEITIAGRGFQTRAAANIVTIGRAPALVISGSDSEVKALVPRGAASGPAVPVDVKVEGHDNVAQSTVTVSPPLDPVDFGFAAEPFVDAAGHEHALITTGLGPAFVLSDAGGRSAAARAAEAVRRLNLAAIPLRASRGEDLEVRGVDSDPVVVLMGKSEPLLSVTEEDAAAYNEDWTRLRGRGGPVTRARLALWWGALARDLVLMLVRGETPRHAAGLAPEGRVLVDLFDAARQTGRFGVPLSVVEDARPATREALRVVGLRVPAAVSGPPGAGAPAPTAGVPSLKLDGGWTGAETDAEGRKYVTVQFTGASGSLSYQRALSVSVPLTGVEQPRKGTVRYSVKTAAGTRFYLGRWDGAKITGTIFSDAAQTFPIGTFELEPER
jgi:hypothetical protein